MKEQVIAPAKKEHLEIITNFNVELRDCMSLGLVEFASQGKIEFKLTYIGYQVAASKWQELLTVTP